MARAQWLVCPSHLIHVVKIRCRVEEYVRAKDAQNLIPIVQRLMPILVPEEHSQGIVIILMILPQHQKEDVVGVISIMESMHMNAG